jgi:hypothetical protein
VLVLREGKALGLGLGDLDKDREGSLSAVRTLGPRRGHLAGLVVGLSRRSEVAGMGGGHELWVLS